MKPLIPVRTSASTTSPNAMIDWMLKTSATFVGSFVALVLFGLVAQAYIEYKAGEVAARFREGVRVMKK